MSILREISRGSVDFRVLMSRIAQLFKYTEIFKDKFYILWEEVYVYKYIYNIYILYTYICIYIYIYILCFYCCEVMIDAVERERTRNSLAITQFTRLHYSPLSCLYRSRDDARLRAVRFREMLRVIFGNDRLLFDLVIFLNRTLHDENRVTKFLTPATSRDRKCPRGILDRENLSKNLEDLYTRENWMADIKRLNERGDYS